MAPKTTKRAAAGQAGKAGKAGNAGQAKRRKPSAPKATGYTPVQHSSHPRVVVGKRQRVFVFGDGDCGQLGMGEDVTEKLRPGLLEIAGEDHQSVVQVVCGGMHTLALMEDGRVYSWGVNDEGALGRPTADKVWNELGEGAFAAMKDGFRGADLEILGAKSDPYVPGRVPMPRECEGKRVVQLSAGDSHSCALLDDGSVVSWGTFRDASGVMGFSATARLQLVPTVVYMPCGDSSATSVTVDSHARRPAILSISSGADHVCALTGDGTVVSWGSGQQGQLGRVGERMSERMRLQTFLVPTVVPVKRTVGRMHRIVVDVACGTYSTFMLLSDGSVYACGLNNYGQLGIDALGVVYAPTPVPGARGVTKVFPGQHHTLFLTSSAAKNSLLSCGRPTYGRLGQKDADVGSDSGCPTLKPVDGLDGKSIMGAAAGLAVSGCFDTEGTAYTWGFGTSNQLIKGDDDEDEVVPKKVASTKRFQAHVVGMDFGGQHGAMVAYDKDVIQS